MFKTLALVCSLALAGCVSTSQYEEDTAKLQKELSVEKKKLKATQDVACSVVMQQCVLVVSLQAAFSGQEVTEEQVEQFCTAQALECVAYVAGTSAE